MHQQAGCATRLPSPVPRTCATRPGRMPAPALAGPGREPGLGWPPGWEAVTVGLGEQLAERCGGSGFVGAGLLEASRLAGDGVGSGVDGDPEGPAGKLLDVASGGGGHGSTVTRNADIRATTHSTRPIVGIRIRLSSWEPPIGIEPMTYALRGGREPSTGVQAAHICPARLASQSAGVRDGPAPLLANPLARSIGARASRLPVLAAPAPGRPPGPHARRVCGRWSWPLRPEAKLRPSLPAPQRAWPAADRPWMSADVRRWPWRLSLTSSLSRRAGADGCWPGALGLRTTGRIGVVQHCPVTRLSAARAPSSRSRSRPSRAVVGRSVSKIASAHGS
jgi:hypothetical protein